MTQEDLADLTDISKRTIERIEKNARATSADNLMRIIAAISANADEVQYLWTNTTATLAEASELAQRLLSQRMSPWSARRRLAAESGSARIYLRILREGRGMSRKQLADSLDLSLSAIADWESGRLNLPVEMIVRAVDHLGGAFDDLLRLSEAGEASEAIASQIARTRLAQPYSEAPSGEPHVGETTVLLDRRVTAVEGVVHYMLGIVRRLLPDEAEEIERTAALWFKHVVSKDDKAP